MRGAIVLVAIFLLTGCLSARVGTRNEASDDLAIVRVSGIVNAHVSLDAIPSYEGSLFELGIFSDTHGPGEIASVELWPVAGVGVGIVGVRVRVLFLEAAVGGLSYHPEPLALPEEDAGPEPSDYGSRTPEPTAAEPEEVEAPEPDEERAD